MTSGLHGFLLGLCLVAQLSSYPACIDLYDERSPHPRGRNHGRAGNRGVASCL